MHPNALQTTTPPPPSLEKPTLMALGTLARKKNLYLNPFGNYKGAMV
jgi:hypothetical protein